MMVDCQIQGYIKSLKYEGTSWKSKCTFQVWENLKKYKWTLQVWGNFSKVFNNNSKALIDSWSIGFYQASQSHHRFSEAVLSHHWFYKARLRHHWFYEARLRSSKPGLDWVSLGSIGPALVRSGTGPPDTKSHAKTSKLSKAERTRGGQRKQPKNQTNA